MFASPLGDPMSTDRRSSASGCSGWSPPPPESPCFGYPGGADAGVTSSSATTTTTTCFPVLPYEFDFLQQVSQFPALPLFDPSDASTWPALHSPNQPGETETETTRHTTGSSTTAVDDQQEGLDWSDSQPMDMQQQAAHHPPAHELMAQASGGGLWKDSDALHTPGCSPFQLAPPPPPLTPGSMLPTLASPLTPAQHHQQHTPTTELLSAHSPTNSNSQYSSPTNHQEEAAKRRMVQHQRQQLLLHQTYQHQQAQAQSQSQSHPALSYPPSSYAAPAVTLPVVAAAAAAVVASDAPLIKRSCIGCRKAKTACDVVRPCPRCVKFGRACEDRSDAEIEAARSRRSTKQKTTAPAVPIDAPDESMGNKPSNKRSSDLAGGAGVSSTTGGGGGASSSSSSLLLPTSGLDPHRVGTDVAGSDALSVELYSASFLAIAVHLDFRNTVLRLHAELDAHPAVSVESMVDWTVQVTLCMLQLVDTLTQDDLATLVTGGLTEEQLASPQWINSPIAPWARLSTRPLHYAVVPNSAVHQEHVLGSSGACAASGLPEDRVARLKVEWLPTANSSFQRWKQMLASRLAYERQLRDYRASMHANQTTTKATTGATRTSAATATAALDPLVALAMVEADAALDAPSSSASSASSSPSAAVSVGGAPEDLASRFSSLGISRALSAVPREPNEHDRVVSAHACWCPLGGPQQYERDDRATTEATKFKKVEGMRSVHSANTDTSAAAAAAAAGSDAGSGHSASSFGGVGAHASCLCALSTPLPSRMWCNRAFEQFFGWKRRDVERAMQTEGFRWHRAWQPPSAWPAQHLYRLEHNLAALVAVATKILRHADSPAAATRMPCHQFAHASSGGVIQSVLGATNFVSRQGEIVPSAKAMRIQSSDGRQESSAIIISWAVPQTSRSHDGTIQPIQTFAQPDYLQRHSAHTAR